MEEGKGYKLKIAVVGPESTGKTTLCEQLSHHYHTLFVKEYAREYLNKLDRPYDINDIISINIGQLQSENVSFQLANKILFCDTTPLVNKIWCQFKFGNCPQSIEQSVVENSYDYYLLTDIDLPWVADPLRENPKERAILFDMYKNELEQSKQPFTVVSGIDDVRLRNAIAVIDNLINLYKI